MSYQEKIQLKKKFIITACDQLAPHFIMPSALDFYNYEDWAIKYLNSFENYGFFNHSHYGPWDRFDDLFIVVGIAAEILCPALPGEEYSPNSEALGLPTSRLLVPPHMISEYLEEHLNPNCITLGFCAGMWIEIFSSYREFENSSILPMDHLANPVRNVYREQLLILQEFDYVRVCADMFEWHPFILCKKHYTDIFPYENLIWV